MRMPRGRRLSGSVLVAMMVMACGSATATAGLDAAARIERASTLLKDGRAASAKDVLAEIDRSSLKGDVRERAMELLASADRKMRSMSVAEISLDRAEMALEEGDLRSVERHATAAKRDERATGDQKQRATELMDRAATLRADLEPVAAGALDRAVEDFESGRYVEAKAGLDSVYRAGFRLNDEQLRTLDRYRDRVIELERRNGKPFEADYTPLGMLQAGKVERVNDPRPEAMAAAQDQSGEASPATEQAQPGEEAQAGEQAEEPAPEGDLFQEAAKFTAERLLAEADVAFDAGRYSEAEQKYTLATTTYRSHLNADQATRADKRLADVRALLADRTGNLLTNVVETRAVVREQAVAEYDNFVAQAQDALRQGDFERARSLAGRARLAIVDRREVFSEAEVNDRVNRQESLLSSIRAAEESARVAEIERRASDVQRQKTDAESRQRAEKDRKIVENLDRIRVLQQEQKYQEALQVVDQVLFLDPENPAGLLLKDVLRDVVVYREWDKAQREKSLSYASEVVAMQKSLVIPSQLMSYPSDWPELSFRRGETAAFVDTPEDRRVLAELDSRSIPASFSAHRLEDVLSFIEQVGNLSVDVNWEALSAIGVERDTEITLNLRSAPLKVVLDRVLEKVSRDQFSRAGWAVEDGVLVVASQEALRKKTFIRIYDIQDLVFRVPDFPNVPELDLDTVLQQGSQRGGGGGGGGLFNDPQDQNVGEILQRERDTLDQIIRIVQENVDFEGWRDNGGTTGIIQELNGNLIITNTAANHRSIVGLLSQLREARAIQISVESRFLTVAQDFFEQIGFDLDVYFNAQNNQYRDAVLQEWRYGGAVHGQSPPAPGTTLLPTDLLRAGATATRSTTNNQYFVPPGGVNPQTGEITYQFGPVPTALTAPDPLSIIPTQQNSLGITDSLGRSLGGFASTILNQNPALGIAGTFLDDVQVDLLIKATQADRRNVTLTAPRLTFINGRFANMFVATQQTFVSQLTPVVGSSSAAFQPTVSSLNTGVTLLVRGVASTDRRYVTMMIQTRVASLDRFDPELTFSAAAGGTGQGGGGATATGVIQRPVISISAVNTGVTVPDQGTILLGGQRLVTEAEIESGVPVLSKLPIINRFFTNRIETKEERTLLILLKPTIIMQNEEEERNFPGLLDRLGSAGR
ncbi:MAG: hypothetical protein AB7G17_00180 [Phycisphaerales bacterium]